MFRHLIQEKNLIYNAENILLFSASNKIWIKRMNENLYEYARVIVVTVCAYTILCLFVTHQDLFIPSKSSRGESEHDSFRASFLNFRYKDMKDNQNNMKEERGKIDFFERHDTREKWESLLIADSDIEAKVRFQKDDKNMDSFNQHMDRIKRSSSQVPPEEFSFSEWSTWSDCDSIDCKVPGYQQKLRNCYGTNLEERQDHPCKYDNLVKIRPCYPIECKNDTQAIISWSPWTKWSECSITCGRGGSQTRIRNCFTEDNHKIPIENCPGKTLQKRLCQYSVSCPVWDTWSVWSSCSQTCGEGAMYRERSCVAYWYFAIDADDENASEINRENNLTVNPEFVAELFENNTSFMKSNMLKQNVGMTITLDKNEVFIVDAIKLSNMKILNVQEESQIKVKLPAEKCSHQMGTVTDKMNCDVRNRCPSKWGAWSKWTPCRPVCGAGMSKRERKCIRNIENEPCSGRRFLYRRCYSSPCWSQWVEVEPCSATCGAGLVKRRRKCSSKTTPPYRCFGPDQDIEKCKIKPCDDDSWTNWSEFSECTVSCNGGFQHRNRTCTQENCHGSSNDIKLCNRQRCPTWGKWGPYTCCNVTCGHGTRERHRDCVNGNIGDFGCNGTTTATHPCYRPPCKNSMQMSSTIGNIACGIQPRATLKNAVFLRIFGGKMSVPHGWPWQASWQHRISEKNPWKHSCGGSLIHPRWVLTAGHCIQETAFPVLLSDPGLWWSVVLGMDKLYKDGERYFVDRIYVHEDYAREVVTINDIALIKLRNMVPITEIISPICLPGIRKPEPGEQCIVSGWGLTGPDARHSQVLLEANVPVVSFDKCQTLGAYYRHFLTRNMHLCAGNPIDVKGDSCTGDSGGPLSCKSGASWYMAAVTSFGFAECGTPGNLGIYTELNNYQDWIQNITQLHTFDEC
ncbi:uncharacterized protein LOC120343189 isoform X1 [Styela clava]